MSACMASGTLRRDDPVLAADHLGALLEAEILEPLLLRVREGIPGEQGDSAGGKTCCSRFPQGLRARGPANEAAANPIEAAAGGVSARRAPPPADRKKRARELERLLREDVKSRSPCCLVAGPCPNN